MLKKPLNRKKKFNKASYITVNIEKTDHGSFIKEIDEPANRLEETKRCSI